MLKAVVAIYKNGEESVTCPLCPIGAPYCYERFSGPELPVACMYLDHVETVDWQPLVVCKRDEEGTHHA